MFACGYQGTQTDGSDDFMEKSKFKPIFMNQFISSISCGLSGAAALSKEGHAFVWGRFGKLVYNVPKKVK